MIELSHVKYALLFCARVLLRNLQRIFFVKKLKILECLLPVTLFCQGVCIR